MNQPILSRRYRRPVKTADEFDDVIDGDHGVRWTYRMNAHDEFDRSRMEERKGLR
jgi:hypothetical protein